MALLKAQTSSYNSSSVQSSLVLHLRYSRSKPELFVKIYDDLFPSSSSRGNFLPTQSQASYHSASSSPSARRPSSGFDGVNEDANVRANAAIVDRHADVRASAMMTVDIDDDDGNFVDTLSEILGSSSKVTTSLGLDLAFDTVDATVDRTCTSLLSPLSHFSPPISSPPSSAAAGEPI